MLNYLEAKVSEFTLRCFSKVIYVHIHVQLTPESREARGLIFHSALNQLGICERILNDFRSQFLYPSNGAQNSCFASLRIGLGGDEEQRASLEKTKTKTKKLTITNPSSVPLRCMYLLQPRSVFLKDLKAFPLKCNRKEEQSLCLQFLWEM